MSLQFVIGRSGSGKSYQLYREIIDKSQKNEKTNYLIIVPEQFTLETQKDIVSMHPNRGTMNIDILSFMRLAYRIFDEVGGNDRPVLEDTGKTMVLRKLLAAKRKELNYFNSDVQKQGFLEELKSLISEIYQYSISLAALEALEKDCKGRPVLHSKLHDIIIIYRAFKEYLNKNYVTAEEILDVLCEVIHKSEIIKNSIICLDGFTGFTPSQYKLLTILLKSAKKVILTVTMEKEEMDKPDEEFKLFHLSKKTMKKLNDIASEENVKIEPSVFTENLYQNKTPYRYKNSPALAALERNLFRYPMECFKEEQQDISIHAARDIKQEVEFVIREMKELIMKKNYRFRDIAVVTGDIGTYGRELGRGFEKAGIPSFIDNKREVMSNPFIELIRSVLAIVKDNFDYESILRFLRCGLSDIDKEDVDILENYILALGIRGIRKWQTEWTRTYPGQRQGELIRINEIREQILGILTPLYEVLSDQHRSVKEYTYALYEFGISMAAPEKLEGFAKTFNEGNQLSKAKEYEQIYGIVMELYDKFVELLGEETLSLREYIEVLEAGFAEAKVGLIPPGLDQVMVGDIERTRLNDIKALFFVGVNDGIIPGSSGRGGILTDMERQVLNDNHIELAPTARQAAYTEKFYLYLNMTKPQERLYITYSKIGGDGKALRPSYLIETIKKLFKKLTVQEDEEGTEELSCILGKDGGLNYLTCGFKKKEEQTDIWKELYSYYHSREEYQDILKKLEEAVYYVNKEQGLSKKIAQELYGSMLAGSVTRFEKYAACAFAHYILYGLELRERQEYRLAVPDIGNIFHNALELFSKKLENSNFTWHTLPDEIRDEWGSQSVQEAVNGYGNAIFGSTKRYEYLVTRVERITKRTLWALSQQIKMGDFEPAGYEIVFTERNPLSSLTFELSKEEGIRIQGRIDRLDTYEDDEKLMVKVVDYKSGNTAFDLLSLYYGLQIQLALYMNAALELMEKEHPGKQIIPGGILYYNIDDPFVEKSENREEAILRELKMNGIINSDPEVIKRMDHSFFTEGEEIRPSVKSNIIPVETNKDGFPTKRSSIADNARLEALESFVKEQVYRYGKKILGGKTSVRPYQLGKQNACEYCIYKSVCGFDTKIKGYEYRKLKSLKPEEVWDKIMNEGIKKAGGEEDAMD